MTYGTLKVNALTTSTKTVQVDALAESADLGTAASKDVGVSSGNVVQLDEEGKLPAVDGSQLLNLPLGTGTVSSVALQVPSGLAVSGSPIVSSGTFAINHASGFQAFTTAESVKLATIASGAEVNVGTSLTYSGDTRTINSSTGSGTVLPLVSTSNAGLAPETGTPSGKYLKDDGTWATVEAGASPAGSGTEIQYRNSTAFGAIPNSSVDGTTGAVTLARLILAANGAASTPPLGLTGTWFTGGTATTTKPAFLLEPAGTTSTSWSTSGTGLGVNAPSGFTGNLLDLQVNGSQRIFGTSNGYLYISPGDGSANAHGLGFIGRSCGISAPATNTFRLGRDSSAEIYIGVSAADPYINLRSTFRVGWASLGADGGQDLSLFRDAADTLAQRRTTNAQTFRVYNTFTSATNFERAKIEWASNILRVGTEKGTAGGTARDMELQTDGTTRITVKADGAILFSGIPTSNPNAAGQLWNDGGTLKISAG